MRDIEAILKKIDGMKPIPQIATKVLTLVKDPHSSMGELARVISLDAGITASVLKLANSAYYGAPGKIDSVQRALLFLGQNQVVDLVIIAASSANLRGAQEGYGLEDDELWKHAISSAVVARELAVKHSLAEEHLVFTGCLLKDLGKSVLSQHVGDALDEIEALVEQEQLSFLDAERRALGIDHAELGARVAEKWSFHPHLVDLIRHHHKPAEAEQRVAATVVYVADLVAVMMGVAVGRDGFLQRFQGEVVDTLGLTEEAVDEIAADYVSKMKDLEALLGAF